MLNTTPKCINKESIKTLSLFNIQSIYRFSIYKSKVCLNIFLKFYLKIYKKYIL